MSVNNQQIIRRFCSSQLGHEVHIPNIRSTLYEKSAKVFRTLHENKNTDNLHLAAGEYTNVLKEQIQLIEQYYGPEAAKERKTYQELEALWTLCEVLYFPGTSDKNYVVEALMKWYTQTNKPYLLEFDKQSIYFCKSTLEHVHFWPYAARLVVFGQLDQLSNLFSHVLTGQDIKRQWNVMGHLQELNNIISQGVEHVKKHHDTMRKMITSLNQLPTSIHASKMIAILAMLMGDESITLQAAKDEIHAFVSCSYYQINKDESKTIHESAKTFFSNHNYGDRGHTYGAMRSFIAGDILAGLEMCAQLDWWFIVHIADLFKLKKMLDQSIYYSLYEGTTLSLDARAYFLLTYGSYLNNQFGLWKESFTYLVTCGDIGKGVLIEHLSAMDFTNDDAQLHDVVKFCIDYSMKNDGLEIYEKKAANCLELKEYKKALQYYSQAEKYQYLDQVFCAVLEDFVHTDRLYDIKSLSQTSEFNGVHYIVYRDISKINSLFMEKEFQSAANTFKSLLRMDNIPNRIIPIVFAEGWKLLERRGAKFTSTELLEMKKIWTKLRDTCSPQDFKWYHYYINNNSMNGEEGEIESEFQDALVRDMMEFFDTTAVIIARAIDQESAKEN